MSPRRAEDGDSESKPRSRSVLTDWLVWATIATGGIALLMSSTIRANHDPDDGFPFGYGFCRGAATVAATGLVIAIASRIVSHDRIYEYVRQVGLFLLLAAWFLMVMSVD